ncbi:MAG: hypothetical protein JXA15_01095 [Spirochaetales bacterium]|nr:hypothetical protein [Spirochaetales bacterium]
MPAPRVRAKASGAALGALVVLLALAATSCSRLHGWGLVLWSVDEPSIPSGSVVPVYIRSNIQKLYVIGVPGTKEKAEAPFWKVEIHGNRKDAEESAAAFAGNASLYAVCLRDGLLIRKEPHNRASATQVYRLQLGEVIKLLSVVDGEPVMTGGRELEGEWWSALAADGTRGYVFSNQLRVFDEKLEERPDVSVGSAGIDEKKVSRLFSVAWRPAYFGEMAEENRVDLERFQPRYGFFVDPAASRARLETPNRSYSALYAGIATSANEILFEGTPLRVRFEGERRIVVSIPDGDGRAEETFIDFEGDVLALARAEESRRLLAYGEFLADGARFTSEYAGVLTLQPGGRFTWGAYERVVGDWIAEYSGDAGTAELDVFVDPAAPGGWEGGLTLSFTNGAKLRLAYRTGEGWAEFAAIAPDALDGSLLVADPGAPVRFERSAP